MNTKTYYKTASPWLILSTATLKRQSQMTKRTLYWLPKLQRLPKNVFKKSFKHFLKPYWNQELKDLHKKMELYRSAWIKCGKPSQSNQITYMDYKRVKQSFRQCHRKHMNKYLQGQLEKIDRLAEVDRAQ